MKVAAASTCLRLACVLVVALVALGWPRSSLAQDACTAEIRRLKVLAKDATLTIGDTRGLKVGDAVAVSWKRTRRFPASTPIYAVLAIPGEARFELTIAPRESGQEPEAGLDMDLGNRAFPGVLALTAAAAGPHGLKAGQGQTRLVIPLHSAKSHPRGSLVMRMLTAGSQTLTTTIVAVTPCGERELSTPKHKTVSIAPAPPEVVIHNPYDTEVPIRAMASNNGRYMVQVFKGRYRVFETATGAKLLDRPGHAPNFSPTSRFIAADIGDADGDDFEVIDLISRTVVARPLGPFVGWLYGDSVLLDGPFQYGLGLRQSLISRSGIGELWNRFILEHTDMALTDDHDDRLWSYIGSECHACASWNSHVSIDLEGRCDVDLAIETETPHACPLQGEGRVWQATEPLAFSHVITASQELRLSGDASEETEQEADQLAALKNAVVQHREIPTDAIPQQLAAVLDRTKVRGDWIVATPRGERPRPGGLAGRLRTELEAFGVRLAPLNRREIVSFTPLSGEDLGLGITAQYGTTDEDAERITNRLVSEAPALEKELVAPDEWTPPPIRIGTSILGLWRWVVEGHPLYLLQTLSIEGTGAFGNGGLWLLEGKGGSSVTPIEAEGFWDGNYGSTAEQTRMRGVQVVSDRYLVMASAVDRTLAVYDLTTKATVVLKDVPHADLIEDIAMSRDGRLVIQINSDGQFFIHELSTRRLIVLGRYLDGETVLYTPEGYYWSTYEGAHFVNLRFPGVPGVHPFQQFASVLNKRGIVEARLQGTGGKSAAPALAPPPTADLELAGNASQESDALQVRVRASASNGVAELRFFQDGQLIQQVAASGEAFQGEFTLSTMPHARWLTMLAVDTKGLVSAPQALHLPRRSPGMNKLHAILVGVDTYPDPRNKLTYAKSDARRIAAALAARQGSYYAGQDIVPLLDQDATPAAIEAALEKAVAAAEPQDTILFSFAGHGVRGSDGHYYLTPSGFRMENIAATGLSWSRLAKILDRSKARLILVLDACHAGLSGSEGLATNDQAAAALLSGARAPMLVLAASKGREVSLEGEHWKGGVFTYALSEVLTTKSSIYDRDRDGAIGISELYRALREIVSRETNGEQTPWLARQDLIGDFALF